MAEICVDPPRFLAAARDKAAQLVVLRGGNWNNGANDGAFALNLNWNTGNQNNNVGFRCARYLSIRVETLGPNEIFTEISQRQENYCFYSFSGTPLMGERENITPEFPRGWIDSLFSSLRDDLAKPDPPLGK